ncbi:MAG: alpha/beta fold hydrolase [Nannocystaceae bacterium]
MSGVERTPSLATPASAGRARDLAAARAGAPRAARAQARDVERPRTRGAALRQALAVALAGSLAACATPRECPPCAEPSPSSPSPSLADPGRSDISKPEAIDPRPRPLELRADDGHRLRLWQLEPAAAATGGRPAILLVHGRTWSGLPDFDLRVGDDARRSLMHALAARGWAAYALDLRGYGESERDASGWNTPDRAAADLLAALDLIREREGAAPDLLGWSYGALVSQLAVQRRPDAARKLVLYGYPRDPAARTKPATTPAEPGPPARARNTAAAARSDFITPGSIPEAAIAAFVEASLAADPVRADWRSVEQFAALDPEAVTIPTLVIHGVGDPIARPSWQAALFSGLGVDERQWVVLAGADHAAHLERPAAFRRALLAFLDDRAEATAAAATATASEVRP